MTGKAQSAWRRLTPEVKAQYETTKAALQKRFEPESKRELYAVEFQTRKRRDGEHWEELGDNLCLLADKAFPELERAAIIRSIPQYVGEARHCTGSKAEVPQVH